MKTIVAILLIMSVIMCNFTSARPEDSTGGGGGAGQPPRGPPPNGPPPNGPPPSGAPPNGQRPPPMIMPSQQPAAARAASG